MISEARIDRVLLPHPIEHLEQALQLFLVHAFPWVLNLGYDLDAIFLVLLLLDLHLWIPSFPLQHHLEPGKNSYINTSIIHVELAGIGENIVQDLLVEFEAKAYAASLQLLNCFFVTFNLSVDAVLEWLLDDLFLEQVGELV